MRRGRRSSGLRLHLDELALQNSALAANTAVAAAAAAAGAQLTDSPFACLDMLYTTSTPYLAGSIRIFPRTSSTCH